MLGVCRRTRKPCLCPHGTTILWRRQFITSLSISYTIIMINFMKEVPKVLRVYKVCVCRLGLWMVIPEKKKWGNDIQSESWDFLAVRWLKLHLPMQRVRIWSLVRELGPHMSSSQKVKTWNGSNIVTSLVKSLKISAQVFSHSVVSDSLWPQGLQPISLLCLWNFPGKNTGVGCHSLLRGSSKPRDQTRTSCVSCIGRMILSHCTTWEALF